MSKQNNMRSLNWRQRGWRSVGWKNSDVTVEAPADSILHWDADIDAFSEQTGGPHAFNHAVLSPQYQRNADGSYSDVGAKPAVDVFDGEKWLRSCGAVTNLLPSGAENFATWDLGISTSVTADYGDSSVAGEKADRVVIPVGSGTYINRSVSLTAGVWYNFTFWAKAISASNISVGLADSPSAAASISVTSNVNISDTWAQYSFNVKADVSGTYWLCIDNNNNTTSCDMLVWHPQLTATSYPVPYVPPGVTQPASHATATNGSWFALPDGSELWKALDGQADGVELVANDILKSTTGWTTRNCTLSAGSNGLAVTSTSSGTYGVVTRNVTTVVGRRYEMLVRVKSLVSMSALAVIGVWIGSATWSTASLAGAIGSVFYLRHQFTADSTSTEIRLGCSNVVGASALFESISIQRIQPQPLTLATRVRMGVGSGDMATGDYQIASCLATSGTGVQGFAKTSGGAGRIVQVFDGTLSPSVQVEWTRNSVIRRITQVNTAGTQFRVGYMIEGTHATIQWGSWVNFDGSFGPSTLYRLMLGYNVIYPMWFNKITAWKKQVTDAEILEAMA